MPGSQAVSLTSSPREYSFLLPRFHELIAVVFDAAFGAFMHFGQASQIIAASAAQKTSCILDFLVEPISPSQAAYPKYDVDDQNPPHLIVRINVVRLETSFFNDQRSE